MAESELSVAASPRWRGQDGRLEVWYATFTDRASGAGGWIHHEVVAPTAGAGGAPYAHGWFAWFPREGAPITERFGPAPVPDRRAPQGSSVAAGGEPAWFEAAGARAGRDGLTGTAGGIAWDIRWRDGSPPLWTFSRWAWSRELLPAAQVVVAPSAAMTGVVTVGTETFDLDATGAIAHIYGHGNARRWGWLHADLGGGDVLEVVSAVSRRPGLNRLRPLPFIRLRAGGVDWPGHGLPAARMTTRLALPDWSVSGRAGDRRILIRVHQPEQRSVVLTYTDPDGATATCTNSERADATITVERRRGGRWLREASWELSGTAHAEIGLSAEVTAAPNGPSRSAS